MKKFFVLALLSFFTGCGGASDTEPPVKVEYQSFLTAACFKRALSLQ